MSAPSNDAAALDTMRERHGELVRAGTAINPGAGRVWFKPHGETEWRDLGATVGPMTLHVEDSPARPTRDSVWTAPIVTALACDIAVRNIFAPRYFPAATPQRWRKRAVSRQPLPKRRPKRRRQYVHGTLTLPAPLPVSGGDQIRVAMNAYRCGRRLHGMIDGGSLSLAYSQHVTVSHDDLVNDNIDIRAEARRAAQHISARQDAELLALMRGNIGGDARPIGPLTVRGIEVACELARVAIEKDRRT